MSNVNIERAVEYIKTGTTVYTPIVEVVVNAIQAIEEGSSEQGLVRVTVKRSPQMEMDDEGSSTPAVESVFIEDNGIGFNDENRKAFDTLYTDHKISQGGKGFGRFTCLKYFEKVSLDSTYLDGASYLRRKFEMGKKTDIIIGEEVSSAEKEATGTLVRLESVKTGALNKKIPTIARSLVEKLLPYFITDDYQCPQIELSEEDGSELVVLNNYLGSSNAVIREIALVNSTFFIEVNGKTHLFRVRIFKFLSPGKSKSKISLVAHKREVTEAMTQTYVPEFAEEFFEKTGDVIADIGRNYVIKTYVFGDYLNDNVSLERGGFDFQKEHDVALGISQVQIEEMAAELTKAAVFSEVSSRQEKKAARVASYVESEAPWHKSLLQKVDLSTFPYNPSDDEIEAKLQGEKFKIEVRVRKEVSRLLAEASEENFEQNIASIVERVSDSSKNDLVHYVAMRKSVLELFKKSLELNAASKHESEGFVHNIIFPTRQDSESTSYEDHNLWLIDERLNFTRYLSSDLPLNGQKSERPDIISYGQSIAYRGENEVSNPVTVFEFKKPGRDDFADRSSKEDPVEQIVRYVNSIQDGKYQTPEGRGVRVGKNTPFYGYVICDLTPKVETWLKREKNFQPMPDGMGWFYWFTNNNLYIEVLSWDKVLKDAQLRNKVLFYQLGI